MKSGSLKSVLSIMTAPVTIPTHGIAESNQVSYLIGAIIALFILGYLIYSLLKPDKF